jgi:hypothetical protein
VFSQLASNETYYTGVALLNSGAASANAVIDVYDSAGIRLSSKLETVPPGQRTSRVLTQYFPALVGQNRSSGYVRVTADRGIASFALFGTNNLSVLSAVPAQVLDAAPATRPRIASLAPASVQPGTSATLTLQGINLSGATALQFSNPDGLSVSSLQSSPTQLTAALAVSSTAAAGGRTLAVATPAGTSDAVPFTVASSGSAPVIANLTASPPALGLGTVTVSGSFDFTDADGDIRYVGTAAGSAQLRFTFSGASGCVTTGTGSFLDKNGMTTGRIQFTLTYSITSLSLGSFTVALRLVDAAGNQSNAATFPVSLWFCRDWSLPSQPAAAPEAPGPRATIPPRSWTRHPMEWSSSSSSRWPGSRARCSPSSMV